MNEKIIEYEEILEEDYEVLTDIMTLAFNDDTVMHTSMTEDGPSGYNNSTLLKKLNEKKNSVSRKISVNKEVVGAYTVSYEGTDYTLEMLFINPKYKNMQLGHRVWKDIETEFSKAGRWFLSTPSYSRRNIYFYSNKCGFKIDKSGAETGESSSSETKMYKEIFKKPRII